MTKILLMLALVASLAAGNAKFPACSSDMDCAAKEFCSKTCHEDPCVRQSSVCQPCTECYGDDDAVSGTCLQGCGVVTEGPWVGPLGSNTCGVYFNSEECEVYASKDAYINWERSFSPARSNWPKGCTVNDNYVYYNGHTTGGVHSRVQPICKLQNALEGPWVGPLGSNTCGVYFNSEECEAYANADNNLNWERSFSPARSNWPKGCLFNANYVYYNGHATGSVHSAVQPICKSQNALAFLSKHWVTKGRHGGDARCDTGDCSTQFELDSKVHGVRCCGDGFSNRFGKGMKLNEGCSVYGASQMSPYNVCPSPDDKAVSYSVALGVCQSALARLCTIQELKDNCAANTGCGLDFRTVWSTDNDPNLNHSPITKIPTLKPSTFHTPKLHYAAPRFHDRSLHSCMDSEPCNTVQKLNNNVHAVSCCKNTPDHMWFRQDLTPRCRLVWSASGQGLKHKDQCTKGTWYEAKHVCEANGARLCSRQELDAGCAKSTGCQFDGLLNWSNDAASMS